MLYLIINVESKKVIGNFRKHILNVLSAKKVSAKTALYILNHVSNTFLK
jgi:hypothetical protein